MTRRPLLALAFALCAQAALAHGGHDHGEHPPVDLPAATAPAITGLRMEKGTDGFTLTVTTTRFTFAPLGAPETAGTGHAHVYINGSKLAEMEGPTLPIPELPFGPHDIRLVLSGTTHSEFAVQGRVIAAEITFTVD